MWPALPAYAASTSCQHVNSRLRKLGVPVDAKLDLQNTPYIFSAKLTMVADQSHQLHDAKQALKEIKAGNATGFKPCLYGRVAVEEIFELVGRLITLCSPVVATIFFGGILLVGALLCIGFVRSDLETSIAELWIERDGRLDSEIEYTDDHTDEGYLESQEPIVQLVGNNFTASLYDHLNILKAATRIKLEYRNM